ncbi:MAG TPA: hypothetical protein VKQ32_14025 [Polyangia bacterium]|nr:hypothetical protein [Polyangia bacterium]
MSRGRKNRRNRTSLARGLRVGVDRVELTRGWDGRLGGGIEPCLIIGAFQLLDDAPSLLGRALKKMGTVRNFPHIQSVPEPILEVRLPGTAPHGLALLCLVLEEDRGRDVADLFGQIASLDRFSGYDRHAPVPEPLALTTMMAEPGTDPPRPRALHLLRDGRPLEDEVESDDWMAASLIRLQAYRAGASAHWRIEAHSEDRRNDWTLWLTVDLGP